MDSEQLHHMSLLAQLHEVRRDYRSAVEVLTAIGQVRVSASVAPDARPDRVKCLQQAIVHVRCPRLLCSVYSLRTSAAAAPMVLFFIAVLAINLEQVLHSQHILCMR